MASTIHPPANQESKSFFAVVPGTTTPHRPHPDVVLLTELEPGTLHIQGGCPVDVDGAGRLVEHLMGWMAAQAGRQS